MSQYGSYPNPQLCAKHGKYCETSGFSCKCIEIKNTGGNPTPTNMDCVWAAINSVKASGHTPSYIEFKGERHYINNLSDMSKLRININDNENNKETFVVK